MHFLHTIGVYVVAYEVVTRNGRQWLACLGMGLIARGPTLSMEFSLSPASIWGLCSEGYNRVPHIMVQVIAHVSS